jgi:glycerate 2-kinase
LQRHVSEYQQAVPGRFLGGSVTRNNWQDPRAFLRNLFDTAVTAADPVRTVAQNLPAPPKGRTIVVGAGKASAAMAAALEQAWSSPLEGLVVTRYGYAVPCQRIEIAEAAHPVPDAAGEAAARRMLERVHGLTADDLVIALMSGGGSALLPLPPPGLTLEDKQAVNRALLNCGMPIHEMNVIRKHLSGIKGGRLAAAAAPARVVTLVVSDIPGDDPALVASGPTISDDRGPDEARAIIARYGLLLPVAAMGWIATDACAAPRPGDPAFVRNTVHLIASAALSLKAAAAQAETAGIRTHILSDAIEGEARDIGAMHAALAREIATRDQPFQRPALILSGGETTVTLTDGKAGKGGRNSEFLLAFALKIAGLEGVHALAADTDGIDGSEPNAGAFADGSSTARMRAAGIDPLQSLRDHDAWTAFSAVGDLLVTGPTRTNVNDFRAILVR